MGTPLAVIAKTQLKPIWRGKQRERERETIEEQRGRIKLAFE